MKISRTLGTLTLLTAIVVGIAGCSNDSVGSDASDTAASDTVATIPASSPSPEKPENKDPATTDGSFCEVMLTDIDTAATTYAVNISGMTSADQVKKKLALVEQITTPPEGLEEEFAIWKTYLQTAVTSIDDISAMTAAYDDTTEAAGQALFRVYVDECMSRL
ncbi:hypothetical protein CMUST_05705 [Corynebacterium mustelae]|uniref:Lipoprotein n=1 Tax=Corynebacterium mustelae TaxID=571915 RepID=A0A0G3H2W7_9CORY|nr:hypothetical protein [Corynebacterium mustelae]AKK05477.1 hypothetical protein CMUST_05705 [Corynebacterium mustelae]